ncbi:hypothetical protein GCM10009789_32950 [Kribbella sancticallisti]|uniref:Uncharacterized protein n=1 Tax=Kribbella sancticallisti TaxID=460087 RepID=A0ABP4PCX4_9ACTN
MQHGCDDEGAFVAVKAYGDPRVVASDRAGHHLVDLVEAEELGGEGQRGLIRVQMPRLLPAGAVLTLPLDGLRY